MFMSNRNLGRTGRVEKGGLEVCQFGFCAILAPCGDGKKLHTDLGRLRYILIYVSVCNGVMNMFFNAIQTLARGMRSGWRAPHYPGAGSN